MTGWIFQATPKEFGIDAFMLERPSRAKWRASANGIAERVRFGDRVFLWRAKGDGESKLAGVVAVGTIAGPVTVEIDDSAASRYWLDRASSRRREPRVEIALTEFAQPGEHVPRDEMRDDPVMASSAIMTARSATNFVLSEEQEGRLSRLWENRVAAWSHADLVRALDFYNAQDIVGLALDRGRYASDARRKLASFKACDPRSPYHVAKPPTAMKAAWDAMSVANAAR